MYKNQQLKQNQKQIQEKRKAQEELRRQEMKKYKELEKKKEQEKLHRQEIKKQGQQKQGQQKQGQQKQGQQKQERQKQEQVHQVYMDDTDEVINNMNTENNEDINNMNELDRIEVELLKIENLYGNLNNKLSDTSILRFGRICKGAEENIKYLNHVIKQQNNKELNYICNNLKRVTDCFLFIASVLKYKKWLKQNNRNQKEILIELKEASRSSKILYYLIGGEFKKLQKYNEIWKNFPDKRFHMKYRAYISSKDYTNPKRNFGVKVVCLGTIGIVAGSVLIVSS